MPVREKLEKSRHVATHTVLAMSCGSVGSKNRLSKAEGAKQIFEVNVLKTPHSRKSRRRKSARGCEAKHISKPKWSKHPVVRPLLEVQASFYVAGAMDSALSQTCGFCSIFKHDGRRGTFEEDLQRCMSRGRRSTRDMSIIHVRRSRR